MSVDNRSEAVEGFLAPGFERVGEDFAGLLADDSAYSGQFSAYIAGKLVVDIWGGSDIEGDSIHPLRHSAASAMLSHGMPLKVLSEILGHSSIAITGDVYGHVSPEVSRDAVAILSAALGNLG